MVSTRSIIFMAISVLVSIGLPLGLFLFFKKRFGLKVVPMLVGMGSFIVFALILESLVHQIVLRPAADGTIGLTNNPLLFMLYASFAAGIFEETGRFLSFLLLKKKYSGIGTGLSYGIGHGGIEAILLCGLSMAGNLVLSLIINTKTVAVLGDSPQILAALETLKDTNSFLFLVSGLERVFVVAIHISLSILVWLAVNSAGKKWLYLVAIVLHAIVDMPAALMQAGVLTNVLWVELLVAASAVALVAIAISAYRRYEQKEDLPCI
ncbi:YhfC family intramembrane metalloprotease [Lachnospiraceae bacterium ZAX-1]